MTRFFAFLVPRLVLTSLLGIFMLSAPVHADLITYMLTATSLVPESYSSFTLVYTDVDGDGRARCGSLNPSDDQLVSFSGMTANIDFGAGPTAVLFETLAATPAANVVPGAPFCPFTDGSGTLFGFSTDPAVNIPLYGMATIALGSAWEFGTSSGVVAGPARLDHSNWSYAQSAVPLPPTALLLGFGLLGLAGWRRFSKN